jgi:type IV pilus assembly protein PilM
MPIGRNGFWVLVTRWLDALPHPPIACEIAVGHVAAARWARRRPSLQDYAVEMLPVGAVVPSPVEPNVAAPDEVREKLERVIGRLQVRGQHGALMVPDQVVRVFLLHFDTFPKVPDEAVPLLRWRLKKSVPFDVEDTVVSYMKQPARGKGVDILAGVARQRIVRQYEELAEAAGLLPGVVLSSTLATLPLLDDPRPTLLARLTGATLTTVIARGDLLCVYRCAEMFADVEGLGPQALLDEIYPAIAYYQDTWHEVVSLVRLAGLGARFEEFKPAVQAELDCPVTPLAPPAMLAERSPGDARALMDRQLDSLVGWMMNRMA